MWMCQILFSLLEFSLGRRQRFIWAEVCGRINYIWLSSFFSSHGEPCGHKHSYQPCPSGEETGEHPATLSLGLCVSFKDTFNKPSCSHSKQSIKQSVLIVVFGLSSAYCLSYSSVNSDLQHRKKICLVLRGKLSPKSPGVLNGNSVNVCWKKLINKSINSGFSFCLLKHFSDKKHCNNAGSQAFIVLRSNECYYRISRISIKYITVCNIGSP